MQCLTFLIICIVVYFLVVMPVNALLNKFYVSAAPSHTLRSTNH